MSARLGTIGWYTDISGSSCRGSRRSCRSGAWDQSNDQRRWTGVTVAGWICSCCTRTLNAAVVKYRYQGTNRKTIEETTLTSCLACRCCGGD